LNPVRFHQELFMSSNSVDLVAERITIDPNICHGQPTIRGLRYPVELILDLLSAPTSIAEILADYKDLEQEDIIAALQFAKRMSSVKRLEEALV
jgi:uncharacterized protein (DUF433 family)